MSTQNRFRYADSVEGVDVEKRYDEAEFPFPSVVYDFTSSRTETVSLSVEDVLPGAVDTENVGFHADYNGADWTVDGDRLRFERELPPQAECRTIYAVSATETEEPSDIFVEPSAIEVSPPVADGDGSASEAVHPSEPAETVSGANDPGTDGATGGSGQTNGDGSEALASVVDPDEVDPADLEGLAAAVADTMGEASGSVDARLSRIEADVAELRAYSDAIADILDDHQAGQLVSEEFEERVSTLESEVDALRSRTGELEGDVEDLTDSHDDLSADVDTLQASLGYSTDGPSVNDRVATLEDRMTEFEDFVGSVRDAFE
jgi:hypothetical protein